MYGALSILGKGEQAPAFIGNTPTFRAGVGDLVQWDVLALGDDTHSFHVHGHRWPTADGTRDVQVVSPASSFRIQ
jgi:FtsP/CotA-like multicopper oxidase with cupredoxin domain